MFTNSLRFRDFSSYILFFFLSFVFLSILCLIFFSSVFLSFNLFHLLFFSYYSRIHLHQIYFKLRRSTVRLHGPVRFLKPQRGSPSGHKPSIGKLTILIERTVVTANYNLKPIRLIAAEISDNLQYAHQKFYLFIHYAAQKYGVFKQ